MRSAFILSQHIDILHLEQQKLCLSDNATDDLCRLWLIGHVPALLILTVNHQKKVKQQQPPQGLQFHGDNLDPLELEQDEFNGPQLNHGEYNCWWQL